jgi:single-strand DNA-binding protein
VNDTMVTVVGNVVGSPRLVRLKNGSVTNFRLASTARRYDGGAQQYVDASTFYVDVECWNDLSTHVSGSVGKGDPVVVHGMLSTHEWDSDAGRRSRPQIKALAVGHNLVWGISAFTKLKGVRAAAASIAGPAEAESSDAAPVDLSDEEFTDGVDRLTGEVVERPADDDTEAFDGFVRGRDYVTDPATLHSLTTDDLATEPAHA